MTATPAPARPTLIYDGDCAFCASCARFARRWVDQRERYEIRPWQSLDLVAFGLRPEDCDGAAQFVTADGSILSGHRAIACAATHGAPGWRPVGYFLLAPGVSRVAARTYDWVAAHRHDLPGGSPACDPRRPAP